MVNTLTQGGVTQTWTLDPAGRDLGSTQTGSSKATVNHFSDFASDSPTWSSLTSPTGLATTSVNVADLTGMLAATTSDASGSTSVTYQLTNARGDVVGTASPADPNEIVTPVVEDEYGNPTDIHGVSTVGPRYGWLGGHQRDAGSLGGVVLMGERAYLPQLGRFLSVDPIPGGSANTYDYTDQNPISKQDLNGEAPWDHFKDLYNAVKNAPHNVHRAASWVQHKLADGGSHLSKAAKWFGSHTKKVAQWAWNHKGKIGWAAWAAFDMLTGVAFAIAIVLEAGVLAPFVVGACALLIAGGALVAGYLEIKHAIEGH
jgi:RHS repeat-associated protein